MDKPSRLDSYTPGEAIVIIEVEGSRSVVPIVYDMFFVDL